MDIDGNGVVDYGENTVIDTIGIERIDRLLFFLAELINYDNAAMKDIKHCIELRQACADWSKYSIRG